MAVTERYISRHYECGIIMNVGVSRPYNIVLNILISLLQWSRRYTLIYVRRRRDCIYFFFKYITFFCFSVCVGLTLACKRGQQKTKKTKTTKNCTLIMHYVIIIIVLYEIIMANVTLFFSSAGHKRAAAIITVLAAVSTLTHSQTHTHCNVYNIVNA